MKVRNLSLVVLACCYLILWAGGVASHLVFGRTPSDALWAATAFLFLAGVLVLMTANRANRSALLAIAVAGFAAEAIGVHTGFPFGRYEYTGVLQPQLFAVPLVMAAAWVVLVAYIKTMLSGFALSVWVEASVASLWMVAIDLVIDPLAAGALSYWRWSGVGSYYGIPLQNFIGWFVVSFVIFALFNLSRKTVWQSNVWTTSIGLSIVLFFSFIALSHHLMPVAAIGFGLCLFHLTLAYLHKITITRQIQAE
ncbi:MAG: carotenoid biosynthesis protein [Acidobacteria bacterium]|nr:carotenoid biosynthesis protein [Acidobacteriota bacterium]